MRRPDVGTQQPTSSEGKREADATTSSTTTVSKRRLCTDFRVQCVQATCEAEEGGKFSLCVTTAVGSMTGILQAANLARRIGCRRAILIGLLAALAGLIGVAAGTLTASAWTVGIGLSLLGLGVSVSEVAVNVLGADVEKALGRSVLPHIHGCYSLGSVCGSVCGLLVMAQGFKFEWHMLVACVFVAPATLFVAKRMSGVAAANNGRSRQQAPRVAFFSALARERRLLLCGLTILTLALTEGAVNDWLPLLMVDVHGLPEERSSLMFIAFAATMTVSRFSGAAILTHFGPAFVTRVSGVLTALGILFVAFSPNISVAAVSTVLWAVGVSLGFPVAMSAGASAGTDPETSISVLATLGYIAFLVGPPMLGYLGERVGLRFAMIAVLVLMIFPIVLASAFKNPEEDGSCAMSRD
ncbi:MFS transporter [Paraburkholderia sp. CNPSo 3076]|uniref:MFS transporter n=1 Tax=Paraburkholderia sp. CNPSo 3076 TaxID=2940936 RepID=UPI00224EE0F5|nr:MFS transporter [Paraburkholderia sp. CNPSo 3076]MCX5542138.1 MFS transporter [Paraburkholderia sp. CNPSo 3076]